MQIPFFWNMIPCRSVRINQSFGDAYCFPSLRLGMPKNAAEVFILKVWRRTVWNNTKWPQANAGHSAGAENARCFTSITDTTLHKQRCALRLQIQARKASLPIGHNRLTSRFSFGASWPNEIFHVETLLYRIFTVNITCERRAFRLVTLSFTRLNSDENFRGRSHVSALSWHEASFHILLKHRVSSQTCRLSRFVSAIENLSLFLKLRISIPIIKPTRCTKFLKFILEWSSTCFGQFLCSSSGGFHCTYSNDICHTVL